MTAALELINGTISAPSLTANSDAATGIYFPATGVLGLVANALGIQVNSEIFQAASATVGSAGSGYAVGDTIYETGGTSAVVACFTVATLTGSGVATVNMTVPGIYTVKPSNPVAQGSTSGSGTGCTLNITWNDPTSSGFKLSLLTLTNALIWQSAGASSFVSGLMGTANGLDFATAIGAANLVAAVSGAFTFTPQGYLTPTSNTPIVPSDVTSGVIFYTPYVGNIIPIYNGISMIQHTFIEMSCTLTSGAQITSGIYDVYCFNNAGTLKLGFSPSWSAGSGGSVSAGSCARGTGTGGTALTRVSGIWTNAVAMTVNNSSSTFTVPINQGTYLGSIYISGAAGNVVVQRTYGQSRIWDIWNAYNRIPIYLKAGDSTTTWTYATQTFRPSNGNSANNLIIFSGLAEDVYDFEFYQLVATTAGSQANMKNAIGYNSTSTPFGFIPEVTVAAAQVGSGPPCFLVAKYNAPPALGINIITALEISGNAATITFSGGESSNLLTAKWRA